MSEPKKEYLVFERTQGSKCWTIAFKTARYGDPIPAVFLKRERAEDWVAEVHSKKLGWWGGKPNQRPMEAHIAEIVLPV